MSRQGEVSAGAERGGSPTYAGVQALRGGAACAVVVYHAGRGWAERYGLAVPSVVLNGAGGVDVFFAISGFVMALSASGSRRPGAGEFLRRRVLRVVPLYWLMTALALGKLLVVQAAPGLGSAADHAPIRAWDVVRSLLFVPYVNTAGQVLPILQPGWTLAYEMFFYVVFAAALLLSVRRPLRVLVPALGVLAAIGSFRSAGWPAWTGPVNPLLLEFLGGVLLGYWARAGVRLTTWQAAAVGGVGLLGAAALAGLSWGDPPTLRVLAWGVPAFCVVGAAVLLEDRIHSLLPRWVLLVGDGSYSLYLSHVLVGMLCLWVARRFGVQTSGMAGLWGFCGITLVVSVLVGVAVYLGVEKPMTVSLARWTGWNRGRAPLVASAQKPA